MLELDARTILFVTFATNVTMAYFIWVQRRPPIASAALAARLWSTGFAMIGTGGLLLTFHGQIPDIFGEVLGESLGIIGYSLVILGTRAFLSRPVHLKYFILVISLVPTTSFWFSVVDSDDRIRVILLSAWGVLNCWWLVISLRPWMPASKIGTRTRIPVGILTACYSLLIAAAGIQVAMGPSFDNLFRDSVETTTTIALLHMIATFYSLWCMSLLGGKMSAQLKREIRKRDRMLSVLAHDLRTPFNSLMGGAEALRLFIQRGDLDRASRMADNVHTASGEALTLVENLLYWGRNQLGGAAPEPVGVALAVEEAIGPLRQSFDSKEMRLRIDVDPAVQVLAEQGGLEAILRNLLSNALKFSPRGSVVDIEAERVETGHVVLTIRDHGLGMSHKMLSQVSDRTIGTTSRGTDGEPGTGLGLSFCRDLTASYQGHLEIDSIEGEGTTVRVILPDCGGMVPPRPDNDAERLAA